MAKNEMDQTRRDFLKTAGIAGVVATVSSVLPGCGTTTTPTSGGGYLPDTWDKETEIVVVGIGFAGLAASISATELGAKVVVLEKAPVEFEGGNSRVCGQSFTTPTNVADGVTYFKACAAGHMTDIPDSFITTWATESMKVNAWMEKQSGKAMTAMGNAFFAPELIGLSPAGASLQCYVNGSAGGGKMWTPLRAAATSKGITVINQARATELYYTADKTICGVKYTDLATNTSKSIKATKGVIICSGGFEFNETLKHNYLSAPCYGFGSPYNTGDGIPMTIAVGADQWHMNTCAGPIWLGYLNKDIDSRFPDAPHQLNYNKSDAIIVDVHGNRFMNEAGDSLHGKGFHEFFHYEAKITSKTAPQSGYYGFPRNPAWLVVGDTGGKTALVSVSGTMGWEAAFRTDKYKWSADNSDEVAKGWVLTDTTIEGLAAKMKLTPGGDVNLKATIDKFNADAALATPLDSAFGRTGIKPMITNYYAIPLVPGMVNTQGGPKYNEKAQVVDTKGQPIKHLYKAGELGAPFAWLYNGGFNVCECISFGRLAAAGAVAEQPVTL